MKQFFLSSVLMLLVTITSNSQNLTARILNGNNEPLPFATVKIENQAELISNNEGYFSFNENQISSSSSIKVSFIGYVSQQLTLAELKSQHLIITLLPASFELENITISNKKPDPLQIITEAKNRLPKNYTSLESSTKRKLFFRESDIFKPSKLNLDITKSTGFSKSQLKEVNADLKNFTNKFISNPAQEYKDILGNYYSGKVKTKDDKTFFLSKLDVIKATNIKGNMSAASFDDIEENGTNLLLKHLDTTKFYRVKSGLFGSRDTVTLNKEYNSKDKKKAVSKVVSNKFKIQTFLAKQYFNKHKLNFITETNLYSYILQETIYDDTENDIIYVISFSPRKSKAIYQGTLYINESDYAVIKCNYELAEGKKVSGFNLKFLLGVKASENISKGTLLFKKDRLNKNYNLQYAYEESGQYFYVNRPLKFIELTKEEKDVVALDIKVEGNTVTKTELLTITKEEISDTDFTNFKETDFDFIKLNQYDPEIWKNHISIEPSHAMKQYRTSNDF
ncbi:carboxypeptidase-like regulatory domain-containing protein [Flavobacterium sp.]|uniref:carboxypeptidase-like regulatory domain-containing protein n=1 Tax=Flavobacterium sp. TaxID=239 RepID=UPI0028BDAB78|nr:carboxypeptidase-like regulatory domain-containing protein [Flavobacterium sp.]